MEVLFEDIGEACLHDQSYTGYAVCHRLQTETYRLWRQPETWRMLWLIREQCTGENRRVIEQVRCWTYFIPN